MDRTNRSVRIILTATSKDGKGEEKRVVSINQGLNAYKNFRLLVEAKHHLAWYVQKRHEMEGVEPQDVTLEVEEEKPSPKGPVVAPPEESEFDRLNQLNQDLIRSEHQ